MRNCGFGLAKASTQVMGTHDYQTPNMLLQSIGAMGGHDDSGSSEKKSIGVANDVPTFNAENMQNNMKAVYYWQYYQVLQQQPNFVHQFYNEAGTMLRIDGNSRETATSMLNDHDPSKLVAETPCELLRLMDLSREKSGGHCCNQQNARP
ncbi:Acetyl-CoA carboxylase 2 [Camellia lanceoleosa]|uniref:Acetyl-CoA carboxylase 2 n=1 Tax=Camellia lanceoleosa TaxID=1840588 RepID=A0ACC0GTC0_9ERIC|nr:Acetyl-CoA carboxylase 2 [Camellia lanceoleosa]